MDFSPLVVHFYKTLLTPGEYVCPFGFGVVVLDINGYHLILTSLNVEKLTQRQNVQKRLSDKDFSPRLRSCLNFIEKSFYVKYNSL